MAVWHCVRYLLLHRSFASLGPRAREGDAGLTLEGVLILGSAMLVVGVVILAIAVCVFIQRWLFLTRARTATGEVVENVDRGGGSGGSSYHPVIEFQTEAGKTVTFEDSVGTSWIRYQTGQRVSVLYEPDRPKEARIRSFLSLWLVCLICAVMGLMFASCGGLLSSGALLIQ